GAKAQSTIRVSTSSTGQQSNNVSWLSSISGDGGLVAFASAADNLVPSDTNANFDEFVKVLATGATERASVASGGQQGYGGQSGDDGYACQPGVSSDGRYIAFVSDAVNLVPGDTNGFGDVFVHDRLANTTVRASARSGGGQGDGVSTQPAISA